MATAFRSHPRVQVDGRFFRLGEGKFYLKGVSPPHVTINQIFSGMMPYMLIVILCLAIMYVWPGMTLWLPTYLYGG